MAQWWERSLPYQFGQAPNSNSTRNKVDIEPLCGCATSKSLFLLIYLFFLIQMEHNMVKNPNW